MNPLKEISYFSQVLSKKVSSKFTVAQGFGLSFNLVFALGIGLGICGCSDNTNTAGGGPSGTEAGNAITAQILNNSSPAISAQVKLVLSESLDPTTDSYTATTDSQGVVTFQGVLKGDYIMEAIHNGMALQVKVSVADSSVDLGSKDLQTTVSVSGAIDGNGFVRVRGLDHSVNVSDGNFKLDSLPAGHLDLVFIPHDTNNDTVSSYIFLNPGESATAGTFAKESHSLLLDDFEDGDSRHRFAPLYFDLYDGGWWYVSNSESVIISSGTAFADNFEELLTVEETTENKAFHGIFDFDSLSASNFDSTGTQIAWSWANVGVAIGSNNKTICYDLSTADSLVFKAKGSGSIDFILVDETDTTDAQKGKFGRTTITLEEEWNRYSIPLSSEEILNRIECVTLLAWEFSENTEIWLDQIELVGAHRNSIWNK